MQKQAKKRKRKEKTERQKQLWLPEKQILKQFLQKEIAYFKQNQYTRQAHVQAHAYRAMWKCLRMTKSRKDTGRNSFLERMNVERKLLWRDVL